MLFCGITEKDFSYSTVIAYLTQKELTMWGLDAAIDIDKPDEMIDTDFIRIALDCASDLGLIGSIVRTSCENLTDEDLYSLNSNFTRGTNDDDIEYIKKTFVKKVCIVFTGDLSHTAYMDNLRSALEKRAEELDGEHTPAYRSKVNASDVINSVLSEEVIKELAEINKENAIEEQMEKIVDLPYLGEPHEKVMRFPSPDHFPDGIFRRDEPSGYRDLCRVTLDKFAQEAPPIAIFNNGEEANSFVLSSIPRLFAPAMDCFCVSDLYAMIANKEHFSKIMQEEFQNDCYAWNAVTCYVELLLAIYKHRKLIDYKDVGWILEKASFVGTAEDIKRAYWEDEENECDDE